MKTETKTETVIDRLNAHIASECTVVDTDRMYDDMLDECSTCCDMCKQYGAARILKEIDPTAYRCGKNDYIDGCDITEVCGEEYHDDELDKAKEEFLDALRDELTELESERDDIDPDAAADVSAIESKIVEKQSEIDECERHSF